jgi:leader peptidase (prepilin peptidase) / N-methyltransferase
MSTSIPLIGGALVGVAAGSVLVPVTRRELAAAVTRASANSADASPSDVRMTERELKGWHWAVLALLSGLLPAYVLHGVGLSLNALPPLILVVGLVQLSYCDVTRRLLPKTMVYGLTAAVVASGISVAADFHEWDRLKIAAIGAAIFFAVFLAINLMNPRWMAFGDVRLSFVVGFALAWVSPVALLEVFALANLLAAVVGIGLILAHRAQRRSGVPFGLFLGLGAALVLVSWS